MKDKNKLIITIVAITLAAIVIVGATYAYWSWTTGANDQTNVTVRVTSDFSCGADGGGSITSQQKILAPTTCMNETYAFQRPIVVKPTINASGKTIYMDLNLKVNSIGEYLSQSQYFKYALTTDSESCTNGVVASGSFQGAATNTEIRLLHNKSYSSTTNDPYYLYIWLDKDETDNNTQNQPFDISLTGSCTDEAPTTFTGTIYRYSTESISIGDSIVPGTKQVFCIVGEDYNSCEDDNMYFESGEEAECNSELQNAPDDGSTYSCEQQTIPDGGLTSYETNAANLNKTFYLKHTIVDDIVTESYVEFVVTPEMVQTYSGMTAGTYTLKGGDNGTAYTTNKATLTTAFGSSNCTDESNTFGCSVETSQGGIAANVYSNGRVDINNFGFATFNGNQMKVIRNQCNVDENGYASCR